MVSAAATAYTWLAHAGCIGQQLGFDAKAEIAEANNYPQIPGLQNLGAESVFRKNELALSIEMGCTYTVHFPREPNTLSDSANLVHSEPMFCP